MIPSKARQGCRGPRVLLLDEGFVSGALTAFGLSAAGCEVTVVGALGTPCGLRAGGDGTSWHSAPDLHADSLLAHAERIAREHAVDIVYPLTEPLQSLVWSAAPPWGHVFPTPSCEQRALLRDKRRMSAHVARAGVSVPEERDADGDTAVDAGIRALGLPVVVKGARGRGGNTTYIASTRAAARRAACRLRARGVPAFLQAYVMGPTHLVGGVFEHGRALRLYAARKTLQFPARTGPAAELQSVRDPRLVATALRVFAATGTHGIASADFVTDAAGRHHFLELNPRPWGSIAAARDAGVDLFATLVAMWGGQTVAPRLDYGVGRRFPVFPLYLLSMRYHLRGRAVRALAADGPRALAFAWREPGVARHLAWRALHVCVTSAREPPTAPTTRSAAGSDRPAPS